MERIPDVLEPITQEDVELYGGLNKANFDTGAFSGAGSSALMPDQTTEAVFS